MCGIAGVLARGQHPVPDEAVPRMNRSIVHRGPDEGGLYREAIVALGCRRLSIIDLEHGRQPLHNEDKTVWLVMNGEIYNFRELRGDLLKLGHIFYTSSDTEVAVHLYEEYGARFVEKLHGMFAVALFDRKSPALLLVRDRLGKKPLYYSILDDYLVFGSEIKTLHASGLVAKDLDITSLDAYLSYGFVPGERTMFSGVRKVPAGTLLAAAGPKIELNQYWDVPVQETEPQQFSHLRGSLLELIDDAVAQRLVSDVPLGAFLSGGIDSTVLVGLMARHLHRPVQTFSIGFGDSTVDELQYARIAATHFGTEHHEVLMPSCPPDLLEKVNWHRDEPAADPADVPTFRLAQFARQYVTVVITGEGGDEIFGGYNHYRRYNQLRIAEKVLPGLRQLARWVGASMQVLDGRLNRRLFKALWLASLPSVYRPRGWLTTFTDPEKRHLVHASVRSAIEADVTNDVFDYYDQRAAALAPVARSMYVDIKVQLTEQLLMKVDKMTMAASLEARCPFLDHHVVEFVAKLPFRCKIDKGISKVLLREAVAPLIPAAILNRPKQGFEVPLRTWLTDDLAELTQALLLSKTGPLTGYVDGDRVRSMWKRLHQCHDQLLGRQLWLLLNLAVWHQQHWQ